MHNAISELVGLLFLGIARVADARGNVFTGTARALGIDSFLA
jgi:hypothetical protein